MTTTACDKAFFESTRGQIVQILRRGQRTVLELAEELRLAPNTVRTHLSKLERHQIVQQAGTRRGPGAGKPAHVYQLTLEVETTFSRAYAPVLTTLAQTLAQRLSAEELEGLMDNVGVRLAPDPLAGEPSMNQRLETARAILEGLGGVITSVQSNGSMRLQGAGCPLAAAVSQCPQVCLVVQSLLTTALGVEVRSRCEHGDRPICRFESART